MAVRTLHDIGSFKLPACSSRAGSLLRPSFLRTNHLVTPPVPIVCKTDLLIIQTLRATVKYFFLYFGRIHKNFTICPKIGRIHENPRSTPKLKLHSYASTKALVSLAMANSSLVGIINTLTLESGVEISTISRARTLFFSRSIFTPMYSRPSQAS